MVSSEGLTWTSAVCGVIASLLKGKSRLLVYTVNSIYYYVKPLIANLRSDPCECDVDRCPAPGAGPGHSPPDHQRAQRGRFRGAPRAAHGCAPVSGAGRGPPRLACRTSRDEQAGHEPAAAKPGRTRVS